MLCPLNYITPVSQASFLQLCPSMTSEPNFIHLGEELSLCQGLAHYLRGSMDLSRILLDRQPPQPALGSSSLRSWCRAKGWGSGPWVAGLASSPTSLFWVFPSTCSFFFFFFLIRYTAFRFKKEKKQCLAASCSFSCSFPRSLSKGLLCLWPLGPLVHPLLAIQSLVVGGGFRSLRLLYQHSLS